MSPFEWGFFDRQAETEKSERSLPHWEQDKSVAFVTFRLADSLPKSVRIQIQDQLKVWLNGRGISESQFEAAEKLVHKDRKLRNEYQSFKNRIWHKSLDNGYGNCHLKQKIHQDIVKESLLFFDNQKYKIDCFVVMPNHVHLLVQMFAGFSLRRQCENWLRFTGRKINELLLRTGPLWQSEAFDHLVRSHEQFEYLRNYIRENPAKAGISNSDFHYWENGKC